VDTIVAHLEGCGYSGQVVRLTRYTGSRKDRRLALARFAAAESRILVATEVACEGLNLHEHCHHLVHFELPWNPNRMEQRNGRIDRYGQTHAPTIVFLHAEDSYEGEVLKRLVLKIEVSNALIAHRRPRTSRVQQEALVTALQDPTRLAYVRYRGGVDTHSRTRSMRTAICSRRNSPCRKSGLTN